LKNPLKMQIRVTWMTKMQTLNFLRHLQNLQERSALSWVAVLPQLEAGASLVQPKLPRLGEYPVVKKAQASLICHAQSLREPRLLGTTI
jgi:hypothetical protein